MSTPDMALIEPVPIDDDLCTGLAMVEDLGCAVRFVLYAEHTVYETGDRVFVVKRKIVLPIKAVQPALEMTIGFLARRTLRVTCDAMGWWLR